MTLRPEERFQVLVVRRLEEVVPSRVVWTAIEHGVTFSGDEVQRARQWGRLRNKGVRESVLDLNFWWADETGTGRFATIDLKVGRNTPTSGQVKFANAIRAAGFYAGFAWSAEELQRHLREAGVPLTGTLHGIDAMLATPPPVKATKQKAPGKPRAPRPSSRALAIATQAQLPGWRRS